MYCFIIDIFQMVRKRLNRQTTEGTKRPQKWRLKPQKSRQNRYLRANCLSGTRNRAQVIRYTSRLDGINKTGRPAFVRWDINGRDFLSVFVILCPLLTSVIGQSQCWSPSSPSSSSGVVINRRMEDKSSRM